ncbi:MAG: GNAT family N-acetyltransferase [Halobacteriales archaeon]
MKTPRRYPEEPVGPFEPPPRAITDGEGRRIDLRRFGAGPVEDSDRAALARMYDRFDPADRAQGIPPSNAPAVRDWLDTLLDDDGVNVLAWDGETVAGHAVLVPDRDEGYELAIFVHQDYQGAGIGTALVEALLGVGAADGVDRVWLTVERWNRAAVSLYKGVGFETTNAGSFELEMAARLADPTAGEGDEA